MIDRKIKSGDLLLIFLYSNGSKSDFNEPIIGRTRLIKLLFIFTKEFYADFKKDNSIIEKENLPEFFAWKFGPLSKDVLEDLDFFTKIKFIKNKEIKGSIAFEEADEIISYLDDTSLDASIEDEYIEYSFSLSELGKKFVEEKKLFENLSDNQKEIIKQLKSKFNQSSLNEILKYVYEKYPDFTTESIIKDNVLKSSCKPKI